MKKLFISLILLISTNLFAVSQECANASSKADYYSSIMYAESQKSSINWCYLADVAEQASNWMGTMKNVCPYSSSLESALRDTLQTMLLADSRCKR